MIHFVGAGPGAADLLTIRGADLLRGADCVIYAGSLVSPDLLKYAKEGAEIHDSAYMTLEQIIAVMERFRNNELVRLHTGDPSIYGAIREQMDRLAALGIPYDVCPGVSSFCAAAASLKAEYTLPSVSQTVVITRIEGKTAVPNGETTILFLSAGLGERAQESLLAKHAPNTPAAIVYRAGWADERVIRCTVSTLAGALAQSGINNHALILAGGFLGGDYENSYLYGDRTRERAGE